MATAYLFYDPRQRPLSSLTLAPVTTGTYTFYYTGTTTLAPIYATNSTSGAQLANPISADGAGLFPAIYFDPTIIYRCILKDSNGNTLEDTDPAAQSSAPPAQNQVTVASAGVVDLGAAGSNNVLITGTTNITSFGTSASLSNPIYYLRFSAGLTLVYNASTLILPGSSNIITHANDFAIAEYFGSGVWQVLSYTLANPTGSSFSSLTVGVPASGTALTVTGTTGAAATTITAAAGTNALTLTGPAATNSQLLSLGGTTTGFDYAQISNTGGTFVWGVESSAGGAIASGTSAYSSIIGSFNSTPLYFISNGTARGSINSTGNWAINSASSGTTVTVAGGGASPGLGVTGAAGQAAIFTVAGNAAGFATGLALYQDGTQAGYVNQIANQPLSFYTNNTQRIQITANGNVNTSAPASGAHTLNGKDSIATFNGFSVANTYMTWQAATVTKGYVGLDGGAIIGGGTGTSFGFRSEADAIIVAGAGSFVIRYNSTGNLTIPAPSSGNTLSVNTNNNAGVSAAAADLPAVRVTANAAVIGSIRAYNGGAATLVGSESNHALNLRTNDTDRVVISATGATSINAPSSGTTLTVNGSTSVQPIVLVQAGSGASAGFNRSVLKLISQAGTTGWGLWNYGDSSDKFSIANNGGTDTLTVVQAGNVAIASPSSGVALSVSAASGTHSTKIADSANAGFNAGYLELPVNNQGTPYTAVLADSGKCLYYNATGAATFTIPANASVAYPVGTTLTFVNDATGATNMTIAITTDTMVLVGSGSTGSRTLAQFGRATAHKVTATRWMISGIGLT